MPVLRPRTAIVHGWCTDRLTITGTVGGYTVAGSGRGVAGTIATTVIAVAVGCAGVTYIAVRVPGRTAGGVGRKSSRRRVVRTAMPSATPRRSPGRPPSRSPARASPAPAPTPRRTSPAPIPAPGWTPPGIIPPSGSNTRASRNIHSHNRDSHSMDSPHDIKIDCGCGLHITVVVTIGIISGIIIFRPGICLRGYVGSSGSVPVFWYCSSPQTAATRLNRAGLNATRRHHCTDGCTHPHRAWMYRWPDIGRHSDIHPRYSKAHIVRHRNTVG